jgi:hypothetical protein
MSTKTTFKRIALVTVAALGFGVMSVAPSNAAALGNPLGVTHTLSSPTTTVAANVAAKTILTTAGYFSAADTTTSTIALTGFSAGTSAAGITEALTPVMSAIDTATATTNADGTVSAGGSRQIAGSQAVEVMLEGGASKLVSTRTQIAVTLTVPGTYTYAITNTIGLASTATVANGRLTTTIWTVVVTAPVLVGTDVFITTATAAGTAATADGATLTGSATATGTPVARIDVSQYQDAAKAALNPLYTKSVVVSVSGAGTIGATAGDAARGIAITQAAGSTTAGVNAYSDWFLHADGRSGEAKVTVTVDGVLAATKTFKFLGALATLASVASKKNVGVGESMTLTTTGADANGNATATPVVTAVSADTTIATVAADGSSVTGVKAGTTTVTLTSGTVTLAVPVTVLPLTAPKLAWAFDKDSYEAGEKMTLTITAAGIADGARAVFATAPSTNFTLSGAAPTFVTNPTFAAGVSTVTMYAPATPGKFVLSATVGLSIDTEAALNTAGTTTRTPVELTATISNAALDAAQEATDAALEAIDAGIAAKDAADQAVEAADAATVAAQDAAEAAANAGEIAVAAAEAAGEIATEALDAANAATEAALSAAEAADAATEAATEAKDAADAATAAVAALSAEVTKLMAALTAKVTTLSTLVAKIAKKVKA